MEDEITELVALILCEYEIALYLTLCIKTSADDSTPAMSDI